MKQLILKIKELANLDRIKIDAKEHTSEFDLHLIKYLEYCGKSLKEYIRDYLKCLQPYMVEQLHEDEVASVVCVVDNLYRIVVYVNQVDVENRQDNNELDNKEQNLEELIVSFCEKKQSAINDWNENSEKINRENTQKNIKLWKVYVIPDSITAIVEGTTYASVMMFVTRGIRSFPIIVGAKRNDNGFYEVIYQSLLNTITEVSDNYLRDLYLKEASLNLDQICKYPPCVQQAFTAHGNDKFKNVTMLIDNLLAQEDLVSKEKTDSALSIYCQNLLLLESERNRFIDLLKEYYKDYTYDVTSLILERVENNIQVLR